MKHVLIPCFSNAPDRLHNAVVLTVDDALLAFLATALTRFAPAKALEPTLYSHEYSGGPVHYLVFDDFIDEPEGPVPLTEHLAEHELHGPWRLEPVDTPYLVVTREGFCYNWDGRQEKHGPSEEYETWAFTLEELKAAS